MQEQADNLQERLTEFAVRVVTMSMALPKTPVGNHIAHQIMRSGTSPAPNYGEARAAESRADFIHKTRIVLKELNETSIWLQIILRSKLLPEARLTQLLDECKQLCKIMTASIRTLRSGRKMGNAKWKMENDK